MCRVLAFVCALLLLVLPSLASAASVAEQRRELSRASTSLRAAERFAKAGRMEDAAASFTEAQQALTTAADELDERLLNTFDRTKEKLAESHAELTKAGVKLPELTDIAPTQAAVPPSLAGNGTPVTPANGDTVSFVDHVVPILNQHCGSCHVSRSQGGVSFANYNKLKTSGQIEVGSGAESGLIDVIVSGRMPPNGDVVSPAKVRTLVTWINQGAKFDGDDATKVLGQLTKTSGGAATADAMEAAAPAAEPAPKLSRGEISAARKEASEGYWQLAIPDEEFSRRGGDDFLVLGNLPSAALDKVLASADAQAEQIHKAFPKVDHPINEARVTIFAFAKRIDYSEFGTMVENRQLPSDQFSHAKLDATNPYVAIHYVDSQQSDMERELTKSIATLWVADRGKGHLPEWFTAGAGRAIASRIHKTDPVVREWKKNLPAALASQARSNDFMTGKIAPEVAATLAYGFTDALLEKPGNFDRLVDTTAELGDFEQACMKLFERTPADLAKLWVESEQR
ncbi:c-type cytochrome [Aeoliella mucimassa]|uniref:Planctomycete cytochrome C n=1 Tax=Aeoliella mucimassa TaxID=2527972 RepID=A0A518ANI0_9BACT|nr:hypothetical protein [Aeoliella mucimassa]QDU56279.1 hypothetical protein Pan181_24880 [Aeoliella mucimassa]